MTNGENGPFDKFLRNDMSSPESFKAWVEGIVAEAKVVDTSISLDDPKLKDPELRAHIAGIENIVKPIFLDAVSDIRFDDLKKGGVVRQAALDDATQRIGKAEYEAKIAMNHADFPKLNPQHWNIVHFSPGALAGSLYDAVSKGPSLGR